MRGRQAAGLWGAMVLALVPGSARAEGTIGGELAVSQTLEKNTRLRVDILDFNTESIIWESTDPMGSPVAVVAPDGTSIGTVQSMQPIQPTMNGVYVLTPMKDQWDQDGFINHCVSGGGSVCSGGQDDTAYEWDVRVLRGGEEQKGRVSSTEWRFNTGNFKEDFATDGSFYAVVPGGDDDSQGVIELRLDGLSGYVYEITGNSDGVGGINAGRSIPEDDRDGRFNEFPMYLNPPPIEVASYSVRMPEATGFAFVGGSESGADVGVLPGCGLVIPTTTSGKFIFNSNVEGGYQIICDVDKDGFLDLVNDGDFRLLGQATVGDNEVEWDGTDNNGVPLPIDTYECRLRLTVGEFHYVGRDMETSLLGMRMFEMRSTTQAEAISMYWNDSQVQDGFTFTDPDNDNCGDTVQNSGGAVILPGFTYRGAETSGRLGISSADIEGADPVVPHGEPAGGDPATAADVFLENSNRGNSRAWGDYVSSTDACLQGNGKGNRAFLDTYTWLREAPTDPVTVGTVDGSAESDTDCLNDYVEQCIVGSDPTLVDTDGDTVDDCDESTQDGMEGVPDIDTDGDGIDNVNDPNDDGDCMPTAMEDPLTSLDTDMDGIANYLDPDDDGDRTPTCTEADPEATNCDSCTTDADADGTPGYLDGDDNDGPAGDLDGDGVCNGYRGEEFGEVAPAPNADGSDNFPPGVNGCSFNDGGAPDNCREVANVAQRDCDQDGVGNHCDDDADNDGVPNLPTEGSDTQDASAGDNCYGRGVTLGEAHPCRQVTDDPNECVFGDDWVDPNDSGNGTTALPGTLVDCSNAEQADGNDAVAGDGIGDVCQQDSDGDGVPDDDDNCPTVDNPDQRNTDFAARDEEGAPAPDNLGDACDVDDDNDCLLDAQESNDGESRFFGAPPTCDADLTVPEERAGLLDSCTLSTDSDGDLVCHGTDPQDWDTDDGGESDGIEVQMGVDPVYAVDDAGPVTAAGGGLFKCSAAGERSSGPPPWLWLLGSMAVLLTVTRRRARIANRRRGEG